MREIAEFRIAERFASRLFGDDEGKRLSDSVRKIEIPTSDSRYQRIGELQRELRSAYGKPFFYGWSLTRKYSRPEIESASLFHLYVTAIFEPAGEEKGTQYDNSTACARCGAGAQQVGPLFLDVKRIPKGKDFAATIADEIVVSRRVVELFHKYGLTGSEFRPVRLTPSSPIEAENWFQWIVTSVCAEIVPPTRAGISPFDDDLAGDSRCPCGDLLGLNLLSEVSVRGNAWRDADVVYSKQFVGVRRGLLRPRRLILISPVLRRIIEQEKLKGCFIEVAHMV